jgi:uncharacterized XkdX family phage protein
MWFNWISEYYNDGLYSKADVQVFVRAGWITADQFKAITGDDYV